MSANVVVRAQQLGGRWSVIGQETARGVEPENVRFSWNDWGPDTCSFTLRRRTQTLYPDLSAFTPIEVEVGGQLVWDGRIKETPASTDGGGTISVTAEGWQYHLDDDVYRAQYAHTSLGDWQDTASMNGEGLGTGKRIAAGSISIDAGAITITFPKGTVVGNGDFACASLDLGPDSASWPRYLAVDYTTSGNSGVVGWSVETSTAPYTYAATNTNLSTQTMTASAAGTLGLTITTPRRFLHIFVSATGAETEAADVWLKITGARAFTSATWVSANQSVLKASSVVIDALQYAPLLNQTSTRIATTSFSIPAFQPDQPQTPRSYIATANTFHDYQAQVLPGRVLRFRARPSTPVVDVGAWSQAAFTDASTNSGGDIYSKTLVTGTGPDGVNLTQTRTQTGTLVTRRGFTRSYIQSASFPITTTVGDLIGDLYLANHKNAAFRGSLTVAHQTHARSVLGAAGIPPHLLAMMTGELVSFSDHIDPDTGQIGRTGRIVTSTYDHAARTCQVEIDNTRHAFDALLARLGLLINTATA